jgi:hypothetical protein
MKESATLKIINKFDPNKTVSVDDNAHNPQNSVQNNGKAVENPAQINIRENQRVKVEEQALDANNKRQSVGMSQP